MEVLFYGCFLILCLVGALLHLRADQVEKARQPNIDNVAFKQFQQSFYLVYFLALLGDWLQGPYVYALYSHYGYQEDSIALLYVTGFASSVLLGTFVGSLADIVGRKKIALAYCIIYFVCCLTKLSPNFSILMLGRVMGGVATSMLFSAFESWYVYEHSERHGFSSEWLSATFSFTTLGNGLIAIFAGVLSNFVAEGLGYGPVSPFVIASPPLLICFAVIAYTWPENYGNKQENIAKSCCDGLRQIFSDASILMLGVLQTVVESCMYIFVFLWTPVLAGSDPPYGMVFAAFMVAIMIGSSLFSLAMSHGLKPGQTLQISLGLLATSTAICGVLTGPENTLMELSIIYVSFLFLEVAIGIYFPSISTLKSQHIPEASRANIMNWFRVPMNVITCAALLCLKMPVVSRNKGVVFLFCFTMCIFGLFVVRKFNQRVQNEGAKNSSQSEDRQKLLESLG